MIYRTTRLFSKREKYLNDKETDSQKKNRKTIAGAIAGTGVFLGNKIGLTASGVKNSIRIKKMVDNEVKDAKKVADIVGRMTDTLEKNGGRFKDKQAEDAFYKTTKWLENRIDAGDKGVDKARRVAKAMDNRAGIKGAAIGAAISAPIAYGVSKAIKYKNEKKTNKLRQNEEK